MCLKEAHPHTLVPALGSHHHILANYSVINTLQPRTKAVSSMPELLRTEKEHAREVLTKCEYPTWALDRMEYRYQQNNNNINNNIN